MMSRFSTCSPLAEKEMRAEYCFSSHINESMPLADFFHTLLY